MSDDLLSISTAPPVQRSNLLTETQNKKRYISFSVQTGPGNFARSSPGGVSITNLLSQRQSPSLGTPRLRLTPNFNVFGSSRTGSRVGSTSSGFRIGLTRNGPTVGLTINGTRIGMPTNVRGAVGAVASAYGIPTTMSGAVAFAARRLERALPPLNEALQTLGIPTNVRVIVGDLGLVFPEFPGFPGLDQIGLYIGAGKKWIAEQIAKFKTLIPPFIPGLKINMGMALAAIAVIRAILQQGPAAILKHLLSQIVDDVVGQVMDQVNDAIDATGINDAIGNLKDQVGGVLNAAQGQFEINFNKTNPPRTEYDEDGNPYEVKTEMPDSGIPKLADFIPSGPLPIQEKIEINIADYSSQNSQQKTLTFPPVG